MLRDGRSIGLGALLKPATPREEAAPAQQSPEQRHAHLLKVLATPPVVPDAPLPAGCRGPVKRLVAARPCV